MDGSRPSSLVLCSKSLFPFSVVTGQPIAIQLYSLRFFSILLGLGVVALSFATVRALLPDRPLLWFMVTSAIVFLPMFTFITSSVNSDNLSNLIAALFFFLLVLIFRDGLTLPKLGGILVLLALGLLTKRTTFFLFPLTLATLPLVLWGKGIRISANLKWVGLALGMGIVVIAVSAAVSDAVSGPFRWVSDRYLSDNNFKNNVSMFFQHEYSITSLAQLYLDSLDVAVGSFWARFGWMNLMLADLWYWIIKVISIIAACGLVLFFVRVCRRRVLALWQVKGLLSFAFGILLAVAFSLAANTAYASTAYSQGRYLFPVLIPMMVLFALGLSA